MSYSFLDILGSKKNIKKFFTDVYRTFFSEYPLVVSCSASIPLLPPLSHVVGGFSLIQKIPAKVYVGIKPIPQKEIIFDDFYMFNHQNNQFEKKSFGHKIAENPHIIPAIQHFLEINNIHTGIRIGCIHEKGESFGIYANIISLLTACLFLFTGKIQNFEGLYSSGAYEEMRMFAKSLYGEGNTLIKHQNTYNIEASFLGSHEALILFPYAPKKKTVYTLSEFLGERTHTASLHIDIVILNFGIEYAFNIVKNMFETYVSYTTLKTKQAKHMIQLKNKTLRFPTQQDIEKSLRYLLLIEKTKTFAYLEEVVKNPFDHEALKRFINIYNTRHLLSAFIERKTHIIDTMKMLFEKNKIYEEEYVGICPFTTSDMGGSIMIITPHNKSRTTILKTLEEFTHIYHYPFFVDYISRIEGIGGEGIQIEQDLAHNNIRQFFGENNAIAQTLSGEKSIGTHEELLTTYKDALVMDMIHKKIYIKGKKAGSRELFSQYFTLSLFDQLINAPDGEISNKKLEFSSYSKYKNQFMGKILLPLQKIAQTYFKEKLPITCTGSHNDFIITIKKTSFPLVLIKKLGTVS